MKLHSDLRANTRNAITAHGDGFVAINGRRLARSVLVWADGLDENWGPENFAALTEAHLDALAGKTGHVVLLGTGRRQHFPAAALLHGLRSAGINVEAMDTAAACRTYNILLSEGRAVAAALIVE
jgi:uncharacterized protein